MSHPQVYRRFFKLDNHGSVMKAYHDAVKTNSQAYLEQQAIANDIGAKRFRTSSNHLVAFDFEEPPDRKLFKKRNGGWYPKLTNEAGKELAERIERIRVAGNPADVALTAAGLSKHIWLIFHGPSVHSKMFGCGFLHIPSGPTRAFVIVPWCDAKQLSQDDASNHASLRWEPHADMTEVKHWEVQKAVDEYNEKLQVVAGLP